MRLDIGSLMFNMTTDIGGTPSWGTDLGQGEGYKFNFENFESFLTAMLYCKTNEKVWCPLGKGGGRQDDYDYVLASQFQKIYANDIEVPDAKFILLIVKQLSSASNNHIGRRSLKYSPRIELNGFKYNEDCYKKIQNTLGLNDNSAWFVYEINTQNQDELHFRIIIADKNKSLHFHSTDERKSFVNSLILKEDETEVVKFKGLLSWFVRQLRINNDLENGVKTSGHGYKGESIRKLYEDFRTYNGFTLDCNIQSGYNKCSSKANYIHVTNTGINIRPLFESKDVNYLYLDLYNTSINGYSDLLTKKYFIKDLDLFSSEKPNSKLRELFRDYKLLIFGLSNSLNNDLPVDGNLDKGSFSRCGINVILYGVPGSGKSYTIDHDYVHAGEAESIRLVFHPDYTYSDFVGQIRPIMKDGEARYDFVPGPFTNILKMAYQNPSKKYYLVIEEINRGNAASIFGDIFQLLDRETDHSKDNYQWSKYCIYNENIAKVIFDDPKHVIEIPSNLGLLATMNTSDQNVFTLDTAFQRRWDLRQITNTFDKTDLESKELAEQNILDTSISWEKFIKEINKAILANNVGLTSAEDKRLGTHFLLKDDLILENDRETGITEEERISRKLHNQKFAEKVIKYLWDDAFKFNRPKAFRSNYKDLESLINAFMQAQKNARFNIFIDDITNALNDVAGENNDNTGNDGDED